MSNAEFNPWRLLKREIRFDCPYFEVRHDTVRHAAGQPRPYNCVRMKNSGVAVAAIDAEGRVPLVGQYRYVFDRYTWEVPGGGAPIGTSTLAAARSELKEEIGCTARQLLKIVEGYVSPGTTDEFATGYVAWDLEEGDPQPDQEETLSSRRVPFAEAVAMALHGEISNMGGVAVLLGIQARLLQGSLSDDLARLIGQR